MAQPLSRKFIIAVSLLVAGFAVLFGVGLKGSLVYYLTVGEFLDERRTDLGDNFRVNGNVVAGTIQRTPGALGARFVMTDGTRNLAVSYARETPDSFVDGSEVVVEGTLQPDGTFAAKTLLAKCPSKYEAQNREADYAAPDDGAKPAPAAAGGASSSR